VNTMVKDYDGLKVTLQDGKTINSAMVIWAAGIKGNVPAGIDPALIAKGNRIKVDRYNKVQGFQNIYAVGDLAFMETGKYPTGHPQVASVAIQQAKLLSKNLIWANKNGKQEMFEYYDKGSMATVGRNLAVVDIPKPKLHFGGFFAWMIWMSLHLVLILGVKNRLFVFLNWIYNYFTYDQSLRLMFKVFYRPRKVQVI
jgi:NADH:ubiquinone reductase (H+-translocating)